MVRAWFMDEDLESDQRLEHHRNPPEFLDLKRLFDKTGVEYFKVSRQEIKHLNASVVGRFQCGGVKSVLQTTFDI